VESDLETLKKQLEAIAATVNKFTSEAVQLRVVETLLAELKGSGQSAAQVDPKSNAPRRARRSKTNKVKTAADTKTKTKASSRTASSTSRGAAATIGDLLQNGFFKSPQTIAAIIAHSGTHRGLHFKANECSPVLLRYLRDEKLKRAKNKDGQYEYTQA
jgi:hypothetical protein